MLIFGAKVKFTKEDIDNIKEQYSDINIVTTAKDIVKLEKFKIKDIILMDLEISINESIDFSQMEEYIQFYSK